MFEEKELKSGEAQSLRIRNQSSQIGWLLTGSGVALLLANFLNINLGGFLWPFFVIVPGLVLLWPAYASSAESHSHLDYLAVPGAFILLIGMLLFVMNLFNHFEAFAYSWTLFPASIAAGLMYARRFQPESRVHLTGPKLIRMCVSAFAVLAVLFELFIFHNPSVWVSLLLIIYGVYLLLGSRTAKR